MASAMSPATWAVSTGFPSVARAEDSETGLAFCLPPCGWIPGDGLGLAEGVMGGNRPEASPAPMSELETPFRFGMGPSGRLVGEALPAEELAAEADAEAEAEADAEAEVRVTVSVAAGGVHFSEVTMLAVAVSLTDVTDVALAATGICASAETGFVSDIEATAQVAVPLPLSQPLVNVGFWLAGCEVSATETLAAEPFWVETWMTYEAFFPRWTLAWERWTLTHSSVWAGLLVLTLGLGLAATSLSRDAVGAVEV